MVSTRSIKYKFNENEKVLCYEPDPTKAKVLYDSKVLEVIETKDKRGKKIIEYLIHFQGWNSSWDRRVCEAFVLKDTEENRQLQRDLAEKSQLQIGAYLYRKERKKRPRKLSSNNAEIKPRVRCSSEDGSSGSRDENAVRSDFFAKFSDGESDGSYSDSVESSTEEDRVMFRLGHKLKDLLENDYSTIHMQNKLHELPAKIPIVNILENFVKQYAIRSICYPKDDTTSSASQLSASFCSKRKRRNSSQVTSKNMQNSKVNFEQLLINIELCKEVVDGLRIYFDFTVKDYLLYDLEKSQFEVVMSEENLHDFKYIPSSGLCMDIIQNTKLQDSSPPLTPHASEVLEGSSQQQQPQPPHTEPESDKPKRRLRSYNPKHEVDIGDSHEVMNTLNKDNCVASVASTSSGRSTPHASYNILKSILPLNIGITVEGREILKKTLSWEIVPTNMPPKPSMIYGAAHLARLIVKLPDFLNATPMTDEKLNVLFKHLDTFIEFLEEHQEFFGEQNYIDIIKTEEMMTTTTTTTTTAEA